MFSTKRLTICLLLLEFLTVKAKGTDTLYFKLSNPWNNVKDPSGSFTRKAVLENGYFHCWDYNASNILTVESFYPDTTFTTKLFRHFYFNQQEGYKEVSRNYDQGELHDTTYYFNKDGDIRGYSIFNHSILLKNWNKSNPASNSKALLDTIQVETEAEFPGGSSSWQLYLKKNIKVPAELKKKKLKGEVIFQFKVDKEGQIAVVNILQSLDPKLDEEIIRVVKASPSWKPAVQNQRNVVAWMRQSLNFK